MTMRKRYANAVLDELIIYFMKTALRLQESGIERLPLENKFPEPIKGFLDLAMELMLGGEPEETAEPVLKSEYDFILKGSDCDVQTILCLNVIWKLSCHIHYDEDYYGYILSIVNLWGNDVFAYASRTFYINMPEEYKEKYSIRELIKYTPEEMFRPEDY
ncbi:MAG: hypothetical protein NC337_12900 [Roseburia sp.]|nr:hypothetical protein [Roseburia sp.]